MLWDSETGKPVTVMTGHSAPITSAALSADGRRALTSSEDKTARLWDVAAGAPLAVFEGHTGEVTVARFSPDGSTVSTASSDCTVRLWDTSTSHLDRLLSTDHVPKAILNACKGKGAVTDIEFSSDGQRLVSLQWEENSDNNTVTLWSLPDTNILARVKGDAFRLSPTPIVWPPA